MNPDKTLLADFLRQSNPPPTPVRSNALAIELGTILLQASSTPGRVVLHCRPSALFVQGAGVLQGGALAAMLDFAMSFAGLIDAPAGKAVTTTMLNVAFLRAAPRGDYRVVGDIERLGRNVAFGNARLFAEDGAEPVASATSALLIVAERA